MANDLVKRLRNVQFWQAGNAIRECKPAPASKNWKNSWKAAIDDAKEAEAYAAEMERGVN